MSFAVSPLLALGVSLSAALLARRARQLTTAGSLGAGILGAVILAAAGWSWAAATASAFVLTLLLERRAGRDDRGRVIPMAEQRSLGQVLANGALPALLAALHGFGVQNDAVLAAYLGSVGAVAGDTWATTAGGRPGTRPFLLSSGKTVPAGTPGAVSVVGLSLSALAGAVASGAYLLASLVGTATLPLPAALALNLVAAAVAGSVAGALADSLLGESCQGLYRDAEGRLTDMPADSDGRRQLYQRGWRWLNNDLVNLANGIVGAAVAAFLFVATTGWT